GYNSRLDELHAALLSVKLAHLDAVNQRRRDVASRYLAGLQDIGIVLPHVPNWAEPVWHLFVVRHPERDVLAARLRERGILTMVHYPVAPHLQPAYAELNIAEGCLPISEKIHREVLSLPMSPTMHDGEVERVIDAIKSCA